MALIKLFVCVCSVFLVACGSPQWTRNRGHAQTRVGRKIGGGKDGLVKIVENINSVGEDGSYSYGWLASDGSYKKETRLASGEVAGEFGYKDAAGDIIRTSYGVNHATQFGFEVLSEKTINNKARRRINRKEEKKQEKKKTVNNASIEKEKKDIEKEKNDIEKKDIDMNKEESRSSLNSIEESSPEFKVIDGRRAVIDKRARQLLTKEDIIKNRKAFIDRQAEKLLAKVDNREEVDNRVEVDNKEEADGKKTMTINGKLVKVVRKSRKQGLTNKNTSIEAKDDANNKIMKDKQNNRLRTKSEEPEVQKFDIQMTLPHPMLMKPKTSKLPTIVKGHSGSTKCRGCSSKVPYYTAFIKLRKLEKLRLEKEKLRSENRRADFVGNVIQ